MNFEEALVSASAGAKTALVDPEDADTSVLAQEFDKPDIPPLQSIWDCPRMLKMQVENLISGQWEWTYGCLHCPLNPRTGKRPVFKGKHATKLAHHAGQLPFAGIVMCKGYVPLHVKNRCRALIQEGHNRWEENAAGRAQLKDDLINLEVCPPTNVCVIFIMVIVIVLLFH
jgi:hypothetical protein